MRISNFLLWQLAYTEIVVTDVLWPDFHEEDIFAAIDEYLGRERRYGDISGRSKK
jgi:undecaprenyl diphosphate synthase